MIHDVSNAGSSKEPSFQFPPKSMKDVKALADAEAHFFFGRPNDELSFEEHNALIIMHKLSELMECLHENPDIRVSEFHAIAVMLSCAAEEELLQRQHQVFRETLMLNEYLNSDEGRADLRNLLADCPLSAKSTIYKPDKTILARAC